MGKIFSNVVEVSIYSGIMVCIILILRQIFRKASHSTICMLWILVGIRLLIFWPVESENSVIPRLIPENIIGSLFQEKSEKIIENDFTDINFPINAGGNSFDFGNDIASIEIERDKTSFPSETNANDPNNVFIQENQTNDKLHYTMQIKDNDTAKSVEKLLNIAGFIWITGAVGLLLYGLINVITIINRLRTAVSLPSYSNIYLTENTGSAFVFGLLIPRIYIGYVVKEDDRKYLLAHELKHIKRKDQLIKFIWFLLLSFYWFSPFVWIAFMVLCKDIELACDEGVIKSADNDYVVRYAEVLCKYGLSKSKHSIELVSFGEISVKERIKSIMNFRKKSVIASIIACFLAVSCLVALLTPGKTQAQNLEEQDKMQQDTTSAIITDTETKSSWVESEEKQDNGFIKLYYDEYLYSDTGESGTEKENILEKYLDKEELELYIPADIIEINTYDLSRLSVNNRPVKIKVDENNPVFDSRYDCNAIIETNTGMLVFGCDNTIIPDSVTAIFPQAFYNCRFSEFNIPKGVSKIGGGAFWHCINLERISLSCSIEKIEPWLFYQCGKLSEIIMPASVKSIGDRAFANCGRLNNVVFEGNIKDIDIQNFAFYESYSLNESVKQSIIAINEKAYPLVEDICDDISDVEYEKKTECTGTADKTGDYFFAVLDTLDDDGTLSVRLVEYLNDSDYYYFTGNTTEFKLANNCEIVVKCKHKNREQKSYYLTKSDIKYITEWYVFVQPDGKIEPGDGAYEYVYPFVCKLNEKGEIISLWENYCS